MARAEPWSYQLEWSWKDDETAWMDWWKKGGGQLSSPAPVSWSHPMFWAKSSPGAGGTMALFKANNEDALTISHTVE